MLFTTDLRRVDVTDLPPETPVFDNYWQHEEFPSYCIGTNRPAGYSSSHMTVADILTLQAELAAKKGTPVL